MSSSFVLRGDLCYSLDPQTLCAVPDGYLVCVEGRSAGVFAALPERYSALPQLDFRGKLIVPGLVDLHAHAPQYTYRALGMDLELLEWLERHTFPAEARYADLDFAGAAYDRFVEDLRRSPTTRACLFATSHAGATLLLMEKLEESGLVTRVGKVNMDRNCSSAAREADAGASLAETRRWLAGCGSFRRTAPILTPRFIPSCTDELLAGLGALQRETGLPVQSHLSENLNEIAWVKELCPWSAGYADAYDRFGLLGGANCPTIMAHCVHSGPEEAALLQARGVWVAHCPESNANIASGVAPVRAFLDGGLRVGLGSDIAGGAQLSLFRAMALAIQVSKLRWRLLDSSLAPLTIPEVFWMGTLGGGSFFGAVGSFAPGYELDALVLDDARLSGPQPHGVEERLEQMVYLGEAGTPLANFVPGRRLF